MTDKIRVSRMGYPLIYYLDVNDKFYEVKNIIIYNENGIIYDNDRGFFEDGDDTIDCIVITQPNLRRKINFSNNENFIISIGKGNFDKYPKCTLYIHESEAKFTPKEKHVFAHESEMYKNYHDVNELQIGDLIFDVFTNTVSEETDIKIESERLKKEFRDFGIYRIDEYDIAKILKHYNVTRKE